MNNLNRFLFDLEIPGLRSIFKPYQEEAMDILWDSGRGWISREIWERVSERLSPETVSRASIINFLNKMVDEGYLTYIEETGKGGYHRRYTAVHTKEGFKCAMSQRILGHVKRCFGS